MNQISIPQFRPQVNRLLIVSGLLSISFFGIQALLKVLYVLRLGHGPEYLGIFSAAGALTYMAMSLPAGYTGERIGLLPAMRLGALLTVVGLALLPLTESMPAGLQSSWPIVAQAVLTAGWALFSINMVPALMAATTEQNRNSAYAFYGVLRGVGTLFGTLFGGLLPGLFATLLDQSLAATGPYRLGLWTSAVVGLGGLYFIYRIRPLDRAEAEETVEIRGAFPALPVGILILHVYFINAGFAVCQSFCNAYMDSDLSLSPAVIGAITGVGQLGAVFAPMIGPRLATRWGNGWTMMVVASLTAVGMLPLAMLSGWAGAGLGRAGSLALFALWMPALQVFQMEMVERHWRSLTYGIISTAMGFSFGSTSLVGGYLAESFGYGSVFSFGLIMAGAGAVVMWGLRRLPARRAGRVHLKA